MTPVTDVASDHVSLKIASGAAFASIACSHSGGIAAADELFEVAVENMGSGLKQEMSVVRPPAHRLSLVHSFVNDLVNRGFNEAGP